MNMDQKCNRGEVEFGINYENDMYGDVSLFLRFVFIHFFNQNLVQSSYYFPLNKLRHLIVR